MSDKHDPGAVGWIAIDSVFDPLYPDQPDPRHMAPVLSGMLGGDDPLQGVSYYRSTRERPHWHIVTYGFSDLYDKAKGSDRDTSGFGFELTLRLAAAPDEEPPPWTFNLLQNIARYVFRSGNGLAAGEYMNLNGPICVGADTAITCILFVTDPEAGRIETPNGAVEFLQIVGITRDELDAAQLWSTAGFADLLRASSPLLITDLARTSLLADPEARRRVEEGAKAEGSSCGLLFIDTVEIDRSGSRTCLVLGANGLDSAMRILPLRIPFGRGLVLSGRGSYAAFEAGERCAVGFAGDGLDVTLTAEAARELAATLRPEAGDYAIPSLPDLAFRVVRSHIRDKDGAVVDTIG